MFQAFVLGQVIVEAGVASKAARQTWQGYSGSSSSSSSRSMGVYAKPSYAPDPSLSRYGVRVHVALRADNLPQRDFWRSCGRTLFVGLCPDFRHSQYNYKSERFDYTLFEIGKNVD